MFLPLPLHSQTTGKRLINRTKPLTINRLQRDLLTPNQTIPGSIENKNQQALDIGKTNDYLCTPKYGERVDKNIDNKLVVKVLRRKESKK